MKNQLNDLQDQKEQILSDVESYAKSEYELARLQVIDSTSRVVGALLLTICLILIVFAVLAFCAAAAVSALAQCVPMWAACLIVGAAYLLLIPLLLVCSKALFVNPIVRKLSGFKNTQELKYETLRAEGHAAVQRERMNGYLRFMQAMYTHYTSLAQTIWNTISNLFHKSDK